MGWGRQAEEDSVPPLMANPVMERCSCKQVKMVSRVLATILRHKAVDFNIAIRPDGFCNLSEVLYCYKMRSLGATRELVEEAVRTNPKRRFEIRNIDGQDMIRALQGHSMEEVRDEELLHVIKATDELLQKCVHGTYQKLWPSIFIHGLLIGGTGVKGKKEASPFRAIRLQ